MEMEVYAEEINDPILVENFSDISMVDPLNPVKSAEASILYMKNDTVEDYTSLIDLGNDAADDQSDVGSMLITEPKTAWVPNQELLRLLLKAIRMYGYVSKVELYARFGF